MQKRFHVKTFNKHRYNVSDKEVAKDLNEMIASAVYLQVSTISQALIFVTRSRGWSYTERPGLLLVFAFILAQLVICLNLLKSLMQPDKLVVAYITFIINLEI